MYKVGKFRTILIQAIVYLILQKATENLIVTISMARWQLKL